MKKHLPRAAKYLLLEFGASVALVAACGSEDDAAPNRGRSASSGAGAAGARAGSEGGAARGSAGSGAGAAAGAHGDAGGRAGSGPNLGTGGVANGGTGNGANGGSAGEGVPRNSTAGAAGDGGNNGSNAGSGGAPSDALTKQVDEAVEKIRADTCFLADDTSDCDWADYEVGPREFDMAKSTGEAVLVIDDFGAGFYPELVRYRNRLLAFYRVDGEAVEAQVLSVHLPRQLGDVLVSFAGPEFIPTRALARVGAAAGAAYGKLNLTYFGHGGVVFSHLVDLVPEQPLVLLDLAQLLALPPALCAGIDAQSVLAGNAHFAAIAASLKHVISEQNVRFINASFGSTVPTLAEDWSRSCGTELPTNDELRQLVHVYDPIYDLLFDTEGVVTAQAATTLGDPLDYPFDQASPLFPNRVRVGFISSVQSGLDEAGRGTVAKAEQFPGDGDADVYLNWDCELGDTNPVCADPHYEFTAEFGLALGTVPLMSTSYVDPLGVARLVNLRNTKHGGAPLTNALIQTLRQELTPPLCGDGGNAPCVYQDPIVHRQLEVYRLGYE